MINLQNIRAQNPTVPFDTRPLLCADGITRVLTMETWYWEKLDVLLQCDDQTIDQITAFCLELTGQAVTDEGWDHDEAFRQLLMYYVYRNYRGFVKIRDDLANDAWQDCFA